MTITRADIDQIATLSDLDALGLRFGSIDAGACALLGYQRTNQISKKSQLDWEAGEHQTLLSEVRERGEEIIRGAFLEIYQEYLPMKKALDSRLIESVCDIGCGAGINDLFLKHDFDPHFTLVDIEKTDEQYHSWSKQGSGYASLESAKSLLIENGTSAERISTINPLKTPWIQDVKGFDLVTSLYSCGFHYPVDEYIELFLDTIKSGGVVCIDLRKRYLKHGAEALSRLKNAGRMVLVYENQKSSRVLFQT